MSRTSTIVREASSAHQAGVPHAFEQIRQWHPAFGDAADDELARAPFDLEAARLVYARQHGSATWDALVADLRAVASGERTEPFREAFEALQRQQWDRLLHVIHQHACKADRVEVLPVLVSRGADVNADPYRGTPLMWAAANNRVASATWLLAHGAMISRATFGGPSHGEGVTPLHMAAQNDHLEMARLLLNHGADPHVEDAIYHSSPIGWADHFGSKRVHQLLTAADVARSNPQDGST